MSLFKNFERIAARAGICTADLTIIGEEAKADENVGGSGREEGPLRKAKRAESEAAEEQQKRRFAGVGPPSANVTLVFTSAKQVGKKDGWRNVGSSQNFENLKVEKQPSKSKFKTNLIRLG